MLYVFGIWIQSNTVDSEIELLDQYRPSETNTFTIMQYFLIAKALKQFWAAYK